MNLNIDDLISHYTGNEPVLPDEIRLIIQRIREAAEQGQALDVLVGMRQLLRFHEGAAKDGAQFIR